MTPKTCYTSVMTDQVMGIILVGGRARRLGGLDKSKIKIGHRTSLEHVTMTLTRSLNTIALSAPHDAKVYNPSNFDIIPDLKIERAKGATALAILSCLDTAKSRGFHDIITTTVDTPFLPVDYVRQLWRARASEKGQARPVFCESRNRVHGLHALWPCACLEDLRDIILKKRVLKIENLHESLGSKGLKFDGAKIDPFFNINTPEDLKMARSISILS